MGDIIHLLPDSVANQIAAGEVIQRPASVIKELVENAVDAGAKRIDVVVADAGKTMIQVVDDGKGMSETDARLAFERHATSKIRQASDLFALSTMGFRGEALASIAAVAQVELRTRMKDSDIGTSVCIEGSKVTAQEPVACAVGSSFTIKNLFFNVPARRKFLKSNQTELSNILQEFERVALVHPEIAFSLTSNDSVMLSVAPSSLRQRIINVFGRKLNEQLLSVSVETTLVKLSGFVAKPEFARKKGAHQYFFVNNRYMKHSYFHKAVLEAFDQLIPSGEQVSYFLYFEVDPANIDVNIHPTKTEIKFENELAIWQIIIAAVKESLGRFNAVPTIDFDTEGRPDLPLFEENNFDVERPKTEINPDFNPFKSQSASSSKRSTSADTFYSRGSSAPSSSAEYIPSRWEDLYDNASPSLQQEDFSSSQAPAEPQELTLYSKSEPDFSDKSSQHYQYKGRYIMTAVKSGLMIIDQQRAHIRVLYDRYLEQIQSRRGASQGLLFPEMIQLPPSEAVVLEHLQDELRALGFDLQSLGGGAYSLNAVPAGTEGLHAETLIRNIIDTAMEKGSGISEEINSRLALALARNSGIVTGQVLSNEEMEALVDSLFACATPNYTPDGKVIITILEQENIDRLFR